MKQREGNLKIILNCTKSSNSKVRIQWRFEGFNINDGDQRRERLSKSCDKCFIMCIKITAKDQVFRSYSVDMYILFYNWLMDPKTPWGCGTADFMEKSEYKTTED